MPTKPVKWKAVVKLTFDGSGLGVVKAGETLTAAQAKRLEDEDAWLVEQGLVEKVEVK